MQKELLDNIHNLFDLFHLIEAKFFKGFSTVVQLPDNLNFTCMKAMLHLHFHGEVSMSQLSNMLTLEKGSFTTVANKLIKAGMVSKVQSSSDKRVYNLKLTSYGEEFSLSFIEQHENYVKDVLGKLDEEKREKFMSHLESLLELGREL